MRNKRSGPALLCLGAIASVIVAVVSLGEQKKTFGGYDVHYAVFNTSLLSAEIAARYDLVRGRDKALINVSILDAQQRAVSVPISGTVKNLLGQVKDLQFRRVQEGGAVYFLATLTYEHREALRFEIVADLPGYGPAMLAFQRTLFWDEGRGQQR